MKTSKSVVVQSVSHIQLFATPWTTYSTPGSPVLCCLPVCSDSCSLSQWCYLIIQSAAPSPFAFNPTQHQGLFQWVGSSHSFRISPPNEYSGLISFRIDLFDPCSSRDSQESFPTQLKSIKILWHSAFFVVQLSHPYMTTGKTTTLAIWTFAGKVAF